MTAPESWGRTQFMTRSDGCSYGTPMYRLPGILTGAVLYRMDSDHQVTILEEVVWAEPIPTVTFAQSAELMVLTKALELGQGQKVNIYTDSCYAFATAHVHGTVYKEWGIIVCKEKDYQKYNKFCPFSKPYGNSRKWPSYIFQSVKVAWVYFQV